MAALELRCTARAVKMLTPTVFELSFDIDQPMQHLPGQFISIVIPGAGPKGRDLRRAYSIASPPESRPFELCIKRVDGPGTSYLYDLKPGQEFKAYAPYGDFVYKARPGRKICFIATGTGVAPFRAMVLSDAYRTAPPAGAFCFFGTRSETEILYQRDLADRPDLKWVVTVSQPGSDWKGLKGRVTDYIKNLGADFPWNECEYYLCGNGGMIADVKAILIEKGIGKEHVHQEVYYK